MIAVLGTSKYIEALWNDDQKDLAIGWARFLVGRGLSVAVVDAATLDVAAVDKALRRQTWLKKVLKERGVI